MILIIQISQEVGQEIIQKMKKIFSDLSQKNRISIDGARIKGDYEYYISLLENKNDEIRSIKIIW